ncbi:hypothetical protein Poli38472_006825 [Pythium oligandrum]|uniref:Uncharacterized protein n=1 Tax=Pythium oligandrum TaxID=41045 RepID=A0A8K1C5I1_PYTOL|nr:hypothetical protein Poli38472_006825 [Pythium oligandrum]|eukprot:TMW56815.1 hypothetical protein Poli38472_006825 [Pythium oligandrum]
MEPASPNAAWAASAPADDEDKQEHAQVSPSHSVASAVTSRSSMADEPVAPMRTDSMNSMDSLNDSVESMWQARRAREEADRIAEQKLIDAVCAASLLEFNEKNKALDEYEIDLVAKAEQRERELQEVRERRIAAERKKRDAMQRVIDAKKRAAELSKKAHSATKLYEEKAVEHVTREVEHSQMEHRLEQERELLAVQQRKEEAIRRREEAERKAQEARERAAAMRLKAFDAAKLARMQSRKQIEDALVHDEANRAMQMERHLHELEESKAQARAAKEAAHAKAEIARLRAENLSIRAEQAKKALVSGPTPSAA